MLTPSLLIGRLAGTDTISSTPGALKITWMPPHSVSLAGRNSCGSVAPPRPMPAAPTSSRQTRPRRASGRRPQPARRPLPAAAPRRPRPAMPGPLRHRPAALGALWRAPGRIRPRTCPINMGYWRHEDHPGDPGPSLPEGQGHRRCAGNSVARVCYAGCRRKALPGVSARASPGWNVRGSWPISTRRRSGYSRSSTRNSNKSNPRT